jgi:hypothetical protein
MKGIVYNADKARFSVQFQSIALRTGYLLCDHLAFAGNTTHEIFIEEKGYKNLPMKQKVSIMELHEKDNEEWQRAIQACKQHLKEFPHIKNKTAKIIGAYKKMEHNMMAIYEGMVANMLKRRKESGMEALAHLIDGDTFSIYQENVKDAEISRPDKNYISASNMLKLLLPDKGQGPHLFILTGDFTHDEFAKDFIIYSADDPNAAGEQNVCMEACFTIPHLNSLLQTELSLLRRQLSSANEGFRKTADEWLNTCYGDLGDAAAISFMQQKMVPAMQDLKNSIEENEMLQTYRQIYKNVTHLEINFALVPVEIIWKYYKHFGALTEKTWQVLQEALQKDNTYKKRWPVIIVCRAGWEEKPGEEPASEEVTELPVTVKKYISVD